MMKFYLIAFLDIFSLALLLPIAPVHLLSLGGTRFQLGLLGSLHAVLQLTIGPLIGSWSDTKGRKSLLLQLGFLVLLSNLLLFATSSLTIYVVSRIIFGVSCHVQILLKALISDHIKKEQQGDVFAKIGALIGLSFVIGPLMGSVLNSYGFEYVAGSLTLTSCLSLGLYVSLPEDNLKTKPKGSSKSGNELFQAFANLTTIKWNTYWDILTFKFLGELNNSAFFSAFGILIMDVYNRTQGEMASVLSFFSFLMIVSNLLGNKLKEKFYPDDANGLQRNFHAFMIVTLLYVLMYFCSSFWMTVIIIAPLAFSRTVLDFTWMEMLVSRASKEDSGKVMGVFESMMHMAGLVMPVLTGYVGESYGYVNTLLLSLIPLSIGSLLANYRLRESKRIKTD